MLQRFIDLNRVEVVDVSIVDKEVEVEFGGIDIDTSTTSTLFKSINFCSL